VRQHTIPKCYLESFTDPNYPDGQKPYLWILDRKQSPPKKKSPKNVLFKKDFYTVDLPHGKKDYRIETSLSQLESEFISILRSKILKYKPIDDEEMVRLSLFFSALFNRTISQKEHWERTYEHLATVVEQMEKGHNIEPKESKMIRKFIPDSYKDRIVENLVFQAEIILLKKPKFIVSESDVSFITSDNPYLYLNPEFTRESFYQAPPIAKSTNLFVPLTPKIAFFGVGESDHENQYMIAKDSWVKSCNHETANHCYEYIFSSKKKPDFLLEEDIAKINEEYVNAE